MSLIPSIMRNVLSSTRVSFTYQSRLMSVKARKRFYKNVDVISAGGQYEIVLDSRKMKTPNGAVFQIKSEPLALAVAHEWSAQKEHVLISQMHLTGLCNLCIDNPTKASKYEIVESILNFLDTDTILFFADNPPPLVERQKNEWQPIIDWFSDKHGIQIQPSTSINAPTFSPNAKEVIRRHLLSYSLEAVHGYTFGVDSIKSIILMSAIIDKKLTVEQAVKIGRLEIDFQIQHWGNVEWHHDLELYDTSARVSAAALLVQCMSSEHLSMSKNQ